jgi:hypothetical protein
MNVTLLQLNTSLRACICFGAIFLFAACAGAVLINVRAGEKDPSASVEVKNDAQARAAFLEAYTVFMHPRCVNCHPAGDSPLRGEDSLPHTFFRLRRGEDGRGIYAMKCGNCHQAVNQPGLNMPPGAPNVLADGSLDYTTPRWHLPPAKTPMIFQGRTPAQLCLQLKDPKQNGGLTSEQLIHHVASDPLVNWGWNPGDGRTKPPLSHYEFVSKVKEWLDKGGACPL